MATQVREELKENKMSSKELSSIYSDKLENLSSIRANLENLINEIDEHDKILSKGFTDIQQLIDKQREKFENLSNECETSQKMNLINKEENDTKYENNEPPLIDIKLDSFDSIPELNNIQFPPKREAIKMLPFEPIEIDYQFLNQQIEQKHPNNNKNNIKPEDDEQFDDIKHTDSEYDNYDEKNDTDAADDDSDTEIDEQTDDEQFDQTIIVMLEQEKSGNLMSMDLPQQVENILGNKKKWKLPKKKKDKAKMERDLRKITASLMDLDENQRKYAKLSVLKYYNILFETFRRYCVIGGDSDWLTEKGWIALYKDGFIADKKSEKCKDENIKELFKIIYDSHHNNDNNNNHKQRVNKRHNKNMMTTALNVSEWNDENPWSGIWKQTGTGTGTGNDNTVNTVNTAGTGEEYIIKQIGDTKLIGFIKSFAFCDMNGIISSSKRGKAQLIIFWHEGARKGKRRKCLCTLNKPTSVTDCVTMIVEWKSIAASSNVNTTSAEQGKYTMIKYEQLSQKYDNVFQLIGLARHEYFDAMLLLSKLKYPQLKDKRYESLCKLCEEYLIPYIWATMDNAVAATIKSIFRPCNTELHRLFGECCADSSSSDNNLLSLPVWKVLCNDIFKQDKNAFHKGGKPTDTDIIASFELAKEKYDLELTYKGFENALQNLAHKIFKKKPKQKYSVLPFNEKLKKMLKWTVKLQKSGYQPILKK